jgi:hypothetical protein
MRGERVRSGLRQVHDAINFVWGGKTVQQRFEAKVRVTPGCWIWTGEKGGKGYGRMQINGRYQMAHRLSYEIYVGQIPDGHIVCHTCDNPACVNPDHLWPGTDKSNSDDKIRKGRWRGLERRPGQELSYAKLNDADIYAIRADGRSYAAIGRAYGVGTSHIRDIKLRTTWSHLPPMGDERKSVDGRSTRGPRLSIEHQRAIRADPRPRRLIAEEFKIGVSTVGEIKRGVGIYSYLVSEA